MTTPAPLRSLGFALLLAAAPPRAFPADSPATPPPYAPKAASGITGSIERLSPELDTLVAPDAPIEILAEGFGWAEGPVWSMRGNYLLFSDVPRNVIWKWRELDGLTEYLKPSGYTGPAATGREQGSNGLTLDNDGNILACQHGDRQVARYIRRRGHFEPLATNFQGLRLNSPNDLALRSNGDIYFTDPPYGLEKGAEDPRRELTYQGVYRISRRGRVTLLTKDLTRPNGIALSPDEKTLYVAVSDPARAHYMAFPLDASGMIGPGRILFDATPLVASRKGLPDGIKVDIKGNLWGTGPGGVLVITPDGRHLGTINPGHATANCAWGGDGGTLYLTADKYLCRVRTRTRGPMPGPLAERR